MNPMPLLLNEQTSDYCRNTLSLFTENCFTTRAHGTGDAIRFLNLWEGKMEGTLNHGVIFL